MALKVRSDVLRRKALEPWTASRPTVKRAASPSPPSPYRRPGIVLDSAGLWQGADANPYVDFGNFLTDRGGFLFSYKDVDARFRFTLWRLFAWTAATRGEAWYVFHQSPGLAHRIAYTLIAVSALVNWLIVRSPIKARRTVEVRADCLVINGTDLFWRRYVEAGWPRFVAKAEGHKVLTGIYGTRAVEFFTILRFDEYDRSPEVLEAHMMQAMQQLWTSPQS